MRICTVVVCLAVAACGASPSSPSATAAALSAVTLSSSTVASGLPVTGTITLTAAAPSEGAAVTLATSDSAATVPSSVVIAGGSSSGTFEIQTAPTTVPTTATITATYADVARTATLTIGKLALQALSLSSTSVVGGAAVVGTVSLTAPAPPEGVQIVLASDSALARLPATVTISGGETGQTFQIATADALTPVTVSITATLPYSGSTRSVVLTIGRLVVHDLSLGIAAIPGGLPLSGTVTLSVAAPSDLLVNLSSTSDAASVPPSVTVPAGTTSQTFSIATVNSPPTRTVAISASYGGSSRTAPLTVFAYPVLAAFRCSSTTPTGGTPIQCTGVLTDPAPAGGWRLAISSSDESLAGPVPASLVVPASSLTFQFEVVTAPVATALSATIRIVDEPSGIVLFTQALTISPA